MLGNTILAAQEQTAALQVVRLRAKLTDAAGAVKGMFGIKSEKDPAVAKLEALQVRSLALGRTNTTLIVLPHSKAGCSLLPQSCTP